MGLPGSGSAFRTSWSRGCVCASAARFALDLVSAASAAAIATGGAVSGVDEATSLYRTQPQPRLRGGTMTFLTSPQHYPPPRAVRMLSVMKFAKMHGIGNDYVYVDGFDAPPP